MLADGQKKTPLKLNSESKKSFSKDNYNLKSKLNEIELKLNINQPVTPLKTTSNFMETKKVKQRITSSKLNTNTDSKLIGKKIEYIGNAKQIDLNLNRKENPRVDFKNLSKDELKINTSRNNCDNDLVFLKKVLNFLNFIAFI